jgi:3-isopropylmalate/(R)-2-methylmalate dehydratase small subunit
MEAFTRVDGIAAPMFRDDIDTDALIPVSRMKTMDADFGKALFANQRYLPDGEEDPGFVLNRPDFRCAKFLVSGHNFGCGSSREQAVWALQQFGIRAIVAASFGDIFFGNCLRVGVLPVVLPVASCEALATAAEARPGNLMSVDLEASQVRGPDGSQHPFTLDPAPRRALLEGLDEIGVTLLEEDAISAFQALDRQRRPWVYFGGLQG